MSIDTAGNRLAQASILKALGTDFATNRTIDFSGKQIYGDKLIRFNGPPRMKLEAYGTATLTNGWLRYEGTATWGTELIRLNGPRTIHQAIQGVMDLRPIAPPS